MMNRSLRTFTHRLWQMLFALLLCSAAGLVFAQSQNVPGPGQEIRNTAFVDYMFGRVERVAESNPAINNVATTRNPNERSTSLLDFLYHTPGSSNEANIDGVNVEPTGCGIAGTSSTSVTTALGDPISFPSSQQLTNAAPRVDFYHSVDPVFIRVDDLDEDFNLIAPDTILVTVTSDLGDGITDSEQLVLTETGDSTGLFIGVLPLVRTDESPNVAPNNCELSVSSNVNIQVTYVDDNDEADFLQDDGLVDPFGTVFDSSTGEPVNGATVQIERQDGPTEVYGDDSVPGYPDSVQSGGSVEHNGNTYDFPDGGFRFPYVEPGDYRLIISDVPPGYRLNPSEVAPGDLENFNYFIDENGSYALTFTVPPGPAVRIDIPIDPVETPLFITKAVSDETAAIGDFVRYEISVTNQGDRDTATAVVIRDLLPQGFKIRSGSVKLNGKQFLNPTSGSTPREVSWIIGDLPPQGVATLSYVTSITSAARPGVSINEAQANTVLGIGSNSRVGEQSNIATARVIIREDLFRSTNTIIGRVIVGSCDNDVTNDEIGLPGIRLFMEDGSFVVTGKDGRYHFEGISNRPHVVQVDVQSIPDEYEIENCDNDNRQAGTAFSRFVDLSGGKLWRVDFHVREKIASRGKFTIGLSSTPTRAKANLKFVDYVVRPHFDTLKADLKANDIADLEQMIAKIGDPRGIRIRVVGHTDSRRIRGKAAQEQFADNYELSRARAQSVVDFLRDRLKLEKWQIVAEGRGPDDPVAPNDGPKNWAENRRVVVRIWGDDVILPSEAANSITFALDIKAETTEYVDQKKLVIHHDVKASVILPRGVEFVPGSVERDGKKYRDPAIRSGGRVLTFERGDWLAPKVERLTFRTVVKDTEDSRLIARATARFFTSRQGELNIVPAVENEFIAPNDSTNLRQRVVIPAEIATRLGAGSPLQAIIDAARGQRGVRLQVVGHAYSGQGGSADELEAQSLQYAEQVAKLLKTQLGDEAAQVSVIGFGAKEPFIGLEQGDTAGFNRRVEVSLWVDPRLDEEGYVLVSGERERVADTEEEYVSNVKEDIFRRYEPLQPLPPVMDKKWFAAQSNDFEFVWPPSDLNPSIPNSDFSVKFDSRYAIYFEVNGRQVEKTTYQGVRRGGEARRVSVAQWKNVVLKVGPNELLAVLIDKQSGDEVERQTFNLHVGGRPEKVKWLPEYSRAVADGQTRPVLAFQMWDRWGKPAGANIFGYLDVSAPYRVWAEVERLQEYSVRGPSTQGSRYKTSAGGIAYIELEATPESGEAIFGFKVDGEGTLPVKTYLKAAPRDWVMVGIAEGSIGYNTLKDRRIAIDDETRRETYVKDGRIAFYASGRVLGKWLLTTAYDSSKPSLEDRQRLNGVIDPDQYYTLYGDTTETGYAAQSSDKLYVKLERDVFSLLYGDFSTGISEASLSNYNRKFTGLKALFSGKRVNVNLFAADSPTAFTRDEIPGAGVTGLYNLSGADVVINSETIILQTRDRFRSENIIDERTLTRHIDYNIDYDDGTVYFREPVYARDEEFNPTFIIAEYETIGSKERAVNIGGRVGVNFAGDTVEIGVTGLLEDSGEDRESTLVGTDLRIDISAGTDLQAEYATSHNNASGTRTAYLIELNHRSNKLDTQAYLREQESGFGLGHQNAVEGGTRKMGASAGVRVARRTKVELDVFHQLNLSDDISRRFAGVVVQQGIGRVTAEVGYEHALDEQLGGGETESNLAVVGAKTTLLGGRMGLSARYEGAVGGNAVADYPDRLRIGADFLVGSGTKLFIEQEFADSRGSSTRNTRVGIKTSPWAGAEVRADVNQEISEDGPRVYSNVGIRQNFAINSRWSADVGLEQASTLRTESPTSPTGNTAAGGATGSGEFTAASVGVGYRGDSWEASSRLEYKTTDTTDGFIWSTGLYSEKKEELGFSMASRLKFDESDDGTERRGADVTFGFVLRARPSRWTILDKLELEYDDTTGGSSENSSRKLINNFVVNYRHNIHTQVSFNYGSKYVRQVFDAALFSAYTDLIGMEIRRDFGFRKNSRVWDIGVHADLLTSHDDGVRDFSFGIQLGRTLARNLRLALGYNISGFDDDDLSFGQYRQRGPFVSMQFKFDQHTLRGLLGVRPEKSAVRSSPPPSVTLDNFE